MAGHSGPRRRGLATWALGQMLGEARVLGLDRVLIVCEAGNVASAKTIQRHGGVLEDVRDTEHGPRAAILDHNWPAYPHGARADG